ncbi:MAG: CheY-like chemotaxis protein [Candidatus Latescibacterota bacterium]|jgi:CheY-like chemotaxis protein
MQEIEKIQILAVDDVAANLNVLRLPLEKAGYHFLASPSGEVALKVARHSLPRSDSVGRSDAGYGWLRSVSATQGRCRIGRYSGYFFDGASVWPSAC